MSAALEPNGTTWSSLGAIYHRQGRLMEEIDAWQRAGALLSYPAPELLALGYAELAARRPQKALQTFDKAAASLSPRLTAAVGNPLFANLAHGRAMAWSALGDSQRAISFAEETVALRPERSEDWLELSRLYDREQRLDDARRARERAASINRGQASPTRPR